MAIPGHMDGKITCLCESLIRNDQLVGSGTKNGQIIKIETPLTINDKYFNTIICSCLVYWVLESTEIVCRIAV